MKFASNATAKLQTSLIRLVVAMTVIVGGLCLGGCSTISVRKDLDTIVAMAPEPMMVAKGQEFRSAEAAAKQLSGAQAFRGVGESMQPLYVSGTAIVVTPCAFSQLRAGMSVVYVNHSGRGVAHVLINEMPGGWIAQGVNNREEDGDLVTMGNLVGVITQAYASADTPMRREIASRLALKNLKSSLPQLALNLPRSGAMGMVADQEGTH